MQAVKLLVVGITLIALVAVFSTNAVASRIVTNQSDVFNGLTFDASLTQDDEAYLRENLLWLRTRTPAWWQYVVEAKPLTFVVNPTEGAHSHAAIAECCDASGAGVITFGFHSRRAS